MNWQVSINETVFKSLADARRRLSLWRFDYNNIRYRSALTGQSPATARRALELLDGSTPVALAKQKRMSYQVKVLNEFVKDTKRHVKPVEARVQIFEAFRSLAQRADLWSYFGRVDSFQHIIILRVESKHKTS